MHLRQRLLLAALALVTGVGLFIAPAQAATPKYPVSYNFLQNAVSAGPATSPPGANNWSCRPSAAHPRPVVLVHGTGGNAATNWGTYSALLADHGYCVFALTYGVDTQLPSPVAIGGLADIKGSAQQLKTFVARVLHATGASKVDLVGHSQGTLMPDYYLKYLGGAPYVRHYISLAPLWHGEGGAQFAPLNEMLIALGLDGEGSFPPCQACAQMEAGSHFIQQIRKGGVAVKGVSYLNIVTKYDDVVFPYTSGIETGHPNMRNMLLQSVCADDYSDHLEIASSPNAAQIVLNALDPAHAHQVRCRLTLPVNGFVQ